MSAQPPPRRAWKQDLSPYLRIDSTRSAIQVASVVGPYLAVWGTAAVIQPNAWQSVLLGLAATDRKSVV